MPEPVPSPNTIYEDDLHLHAQRFTTRWLQAREHLPSSMVHDLVGLSNHAIGGPLRRKCTLCDGILAFAGSGGDSRISTRTDRCKDCGAEYLTTFYRKPVTGS